MQTYRGVYIALPSAHVTVASLTSGAIYLTKEVTGTEDIEWQAPTNAPVEITAEYNGQYQVHIIEPIEVV